MTISPSDKKPTVLLVDDDAGLRNLLQLFFEARGVPLTMLPSAHGLGNVVAAERPSIIVMDLMMPDIDGLTALRALRAEGNATPVIMLTARAARQLRVGIRPPPIVVEGPSELKALTRVFNEMARAIIDAEQARAVMLAGVAQDLRAPLTRIQVRASIVEHRELQAGFLQDSASLSQIVTQFLDLARDVDDDSTAEWREVDAFCASHYAADSEDVDQERGEGRWDVAGRLASLRGVTCFRQCAVIFG